MNLITVKIKDIKKHPRNYNEHPEDQITHIVQSIKKNGLYRNIIISNDYYILAGHGVVKALKSMDIKLVEAVKLDLKHDDPQAIKVLVGDNEIRHLCEVNDGKLSELLRDVKESQAEGLVGTGYDEMMLANLIMITRPQDEIENFDAAAEWVGMPEFSTGDQHYLLNISFKNKEDRVRFVETYKFNEGKMTKSSDVTWSLRWPQEGDDDTISVRIENEE